MFTLRSLTRGWRVFTGQEPVRDWHEMADPALKFYAMFLFWLVISANIFAVIHTGGINSLDDLTFENGLLMFTGIAGALSLRFIGRQVAHIVYELARKREALENRDLLEQWTEQLKVAWAQPGVGDVLVKQALHSAFLKKNRLPPGTGSPYLLTPGTNEEGEDELAVYPFASSQTNSAGPLTAAPRNGNR